MENPLENFAKFCNITFRITAPFWNINMFHESIQEFVNEKINQYEWDFIGHANSSEWAEKSREGMFFISAAEASQLHAFDVVASILSVDEYWTSVQELLRMVALSAGRFTI